MVRNSDVLRDAIGALPDQCVRTGPREVKNNAGGFVYKVDDMARLRRFLILGSESANYYVGKHELTLQNALCVARLLKSGRGGADVVAEATAVSVEGRAAKQSPALFALAMAARLGDADTRAAALRAVPRVCRTSTTLFEFVGYCAELGEAAGGTRASWGRAMRRTVAEWYLGRSPSDLAHQVTKYGSRAGWTHRDMLRLAHPRVGKLTRAQRAAADAAAAGAESTPVAEAAVPAGEVVAAGLMVEPAEAVAEAVAVTGGAVGTASDDEGMEWECVG